MREVAKVGHRSKKVVSEIPIDEHRRRRLFEDANAAYALLRSNPEVWQEIQAERADWEALSDGLPDGET